MAETTTQWQAICESHAGPMAMASDSAAARYRERIDEQGEDPELLQLAVLSFPGHEEAVWVWAGTVDEAKATAGRLALAWNSHADLLAACEAARREIDPDATKTQSYAEACKRRDAVMSQLDAAIAKARRPAGDRA